MITISIPLIVATLCAFPASLFAADGFEARIRAVIEEAPSVEPGFLGGTGRRFEDPPHRIVTVAPSATELLFALGAGDRVVGVSRYDDHPRVVASLPRVGGFLDPNVEAIISLEPDLVVGVPNAGNRPALERLSRLGIPVLIVPGNTFADIFHAMTALSRVLGAGAEARARALAGGIEGETLALAAALRGYTPPRVAFVYGWMPLVLAGPKSFADTLLVVLNAHNVVERGPPYPQYSVERLLQDGPEVIIDASEIHEGASGGRPWSKWTTLPAVKKGRIHRVPIGDVLRPGPRIVEGMHRIAAFLHPTFRSRGAPSPGEIGPDNRQVAPRRP